MPLKTPALHWFGDTIPIFFTWLGRFSYRAVFLVCIVCLGFNYVVALRLATGARP